MVEPFPSAFAIEQIRMLNSAVLSLSKSLRLEICNYMGEHRLAIAIQSHTETPPIGLLKMISLIMGTIFLSFLYSGGNAVWIGEHEKHNEAKAADGTCPGRLTNYYEPRSTAARTKKTNEGAMCLPIPTPPVTVPLQSVDYRKERMRQHCRGFVA